MERARATRSASMTRKTTFAAITVVVVATAASFLLDNFGSSNRQPEPIEAGYVTAPIEVPQADSPIAPVEPQTVWADEGDDAGVFYEDNIVEESDGDAMMIPPDDGTGQMTYSSSDIVTMPPEFDEP
ncbi:hypothetical protein GRI97_12500 [Altererythrobacter xixiisoli]|uniref:Uncharacterized protein n=1 Tax=Croceibacterium xixiisoli TaxID=1476466 RepID=A0A6I4TUQ2_9SPHN|nr:hypothetical protein [Croceibacterium xixiisoli]MXO99806.1 hypothetical protein [Croceibacterium xixiisoli]